jgi:hypothetical protein
MIIQYALYKIQPDATGKDVNFYLCQDGTASSDHKQAWLLTGDQLLDQEVIKNKEEEFPFICIDPAMSAEAYFSEYYNLFVENRGFTVLAFVKQDLISLKAASIIGNFPEIALIFFTTLNELLSTYLSVMKKTGLPSWAKDGGCLESIPLEVFKNEFRVLFQLAFRLAPRIHEGLMDFERTKAK